MDLLVTEQFVKAIRKDDDVVGDLTCLQIHIRKCIDFHQQLSTHLYKNDKTNPKRMKETHNFSVIREFMDELEYEMIDISSKQKRLSNILNDSITNFIYSFGKKYKHNIDRETLNGFVNRVIEHRYINGQKKKNPKRVNLLTKEKELIRKFKRVETIIKGRLNRAKRLTAKELKLATLEELGPSVSSSTSFYYTSPEIDNERFNKFEEQFNEANEANEIVEEANQTYEVVKQATEIEWQVNETQPGEVEQTIPENQEMELDAEEDDQTPITCRQLEFPPLVIERLDVPYDRVSTSESESEPEIEQKTRGRKKKIPKIYSLPEIMQMLPQLPSQSSNNTEPSQEEFLRSFGLVRHQEIKEMIAQKPARKRRSCSNNQQKDYHYGSFSIKDFQGKAVRYKRKRNKLPFITFHQGES